MAIRLIASDLDGTLFGADHVPEPRTVAAVNAAVEAGFIFVAATGRSYFGGADRVRSTGANVAWFIGSNGGHRLNLQTGELEERLLFADHDVETMVAAITTACPGVGFGYEHATGFTYDEIFKEVLPYSIDGPKRRNTAEWAPDDIGKLFTIHADLSHVELIDACRPHVPANSEVASSGTSMVELTPPGGNKGLALARLCDKLGVSADEVIAFGDNNNDLQMLEWAGRGVAMANAVDEVIEAADEVTDTNINFGVAQVIESLL